MKSPLLKVQQRPHDLYDIVANDNLPYNELAADWDTHYQNEWSERWEEMSGKKSQLIRLSNRIGYDYVKYSITDPVISRPEFYTDEHSLEQLNVSVKFDSWDTRCLFAGIKVRENEDGSYQGISYLKCKLNEYVFFEGKLKSNTSGKIECVYSLEIHVIPQGIEGNLLNMRFDDHNTRLSNALDILEAEFGISISDVNCALSYIEMNRNFLFNRKFQMAGKDWILDDKQIFRALRYFRNETGRMKLTEKQFSKGDNVSLYYSSGNNDFAIRMYNKSEESKLLFDGLDNNDFILRVEFVFSKKKAISSLYKYPAGQKEFELLYLELVDRFFVDAYKQYQRRCTKRMEEIFEQLTLKENRKWKYQLIDKICAMEIKELPLAFSPDDVEHLVSCNEMLRRNKSRYVNDVKDLFSNTDSIVECYLMDGIQKRFIANVSDTKFREKDLYINRK